MALGGTYSLLVFVDNAVTAVKMDLEAHDVNELVLQIQRIIGLPLASICYWDEVSREYVQLRTLAPLTNGKCKIWVATRGVKAMPITEDKDALEYSTIREQVEKLTPPEDGLGFRVNEILRVQNHTLDQKFRLRRSQLFDPSARSTLKFHAGNQPTDQILKEGFLIPTRPGPYGLGIIFSSDISVAYHTDSVRFLLCEVAVGRSTTLHNEEDRGTTFEVLQHMGYDSVISKTSAHPTFDQLEEYIVYHPHQAIPRYLVTCNLVKSRGTKSKLSDSCRQHTGETLKLWCLTCGHMVCPFCMFGSHAGHTAKGLDEVASKERDLLMRCETVLQRTIEQRQNDLGDLEKMKAHYHTVAKDTVDSLGKSIVELKTQLDTQHHELLRQIEATENSVGLRLAGFVNPLQKELAELIGKQQQLREALDIAKNSRPSSQAEFLNRTIDLHNSLNTVPKFDEAPDVTTFAPSVEFFIDSKTVSDAITHMHVEDRDPHPHKQVHPLGTLALQSEGLLSRDDSLDSTESRLLAIETGHIWTIPNISEHIKTSNQTVDIFSDPFLMSGQFWEMKLSFLPVERMVAVYLYAVRHQFRTNFRVAVFRSKRWHVKSTRNWADEFRGRGWGIKPFISYDDLLSYVHNDTLKWVVTFTGNGLY